MPSFSTSACPAITISLSSLAPGAQNLLKEIGNPNLPDEERLDVKKLVRQLTVSDWSKLLKAFDEWSFAPEVCVQIASFLIWVNGGAGSLYR